MSSAVATGLLVLLGWIASSRGAQTERSSAHEPLDRAGETATSSGIELAGPRGVSASPRTAELDASRALAMEIELDRSLRAGAGVPARAIATA